MRICDVDSCDTPARTRGWCSAHYNRFMRYGNPEGKPTPKPKFVPSSCSVENCDRPALCRGYCNAHYQRYWSKGDPQPGRPLQVNGLGRTAKHRYKKRYLPNHPLAVADGTVRVHRANLYASIGPGPHPCHWCGSFVSWDKSFPKESGALTVDHLDFDRHNNELSNLVPSCGSCNSHRWEANSLCV